MEVLGKADEQRIRQGLDRTGDRQSSGNGEVENSEIEIYLR